MGIWNGVAPLSSASLPFASPELWRALLAHRDRLRATPTRALIAADPARFDRLAVEAEGLLLDFTRQQLDTAALAALVTLAETSGLPQAIEELFEGAIVNGTEQRPALHVALRDRGGPPLVLGELDVRRAVVQERDKTRAFAGSVISGARKGATGQRLTDVVNIGIGGSDLGPVMAVEALKTYCNPRLRVHFVSNVDGVQFHDVVAGLEPANTLFVICSKTFTTQETLANARLARRWITDKLGPNATSRHFAAVSTNHAAMDDFGIAQDARFTMWDWVGGRYSLWSSIGLAIELAIGSQRFDELLAGANAIDRHFQTAPLERNLPVLLGLVAVWNRNLLDCGSHAVLPYDQRLHRFPAYLQQLEMESNGKRVRRDGRAVDWDTGPVIWGEPGSNSQHSFFQLLHQGTDRVSMDFVLPARSSVGNQPSHDLAVANCLAQAEAFANGYTLEEAVAELKARRLKPDRAAELAPHKVHPGDRPSTVIAFPRLDPATLGKLVALYEHKVYVQSVLWDINPFDQWGVELGKKLAEKLAPAVRGERPIMDNPALGSLLDRLAAWRRS
jgi:glucose-6-phosphate isomerase